MNTTTIRRIAIAVTFDACLTGIGSLVGSIAATVANHNFHISFAGWFEGWGISLAVLLTVRALYHLKTK